MGIAIFPTTCRKAGPQNNDRKQGTCMGMKSDFQSARLAASGMLMSLVVVPSLFALAVACFPAGHCGVSDGYSFSRHVVSDLGRTRLSNGAPNAVSCLLFSSAMAVAGFSCALFWLSRRAFLKGVLARQVALFSGMCMSVSMLAIGLTPLNLVPKIHDPITAVTAVAAAVAILSVYSDGSDSLEKPRAKKIWLVLLAFVSAVWSVLVVLHHERLLAFRPWLPFWQKLLIATFVAWMSGQTVLLFRFRETDSAI
ncbi:MAG TPA: hypothetical protein PLG22_14485 [Kiritimatiellia bacterium]|nr:hypothetical protein [Kiritimatiellia bacterium]